MSTTRGRPFDVDQAEYPFQDRWFERDGVAMHYVDEGEGVAVLMLHGNPTWSFLYRKVIKALGGSCRSIAPDYPGFGFSEHPPNYGYTPQEHAAWLSAFIDYLQLDRYVLVMQDWGGPIGMSVAVERPHQVAGLVIGNTWCWPPELMMRLFSMALGGPFGKYLNLRHNFFARRIVATSLTNRESKRPEILKAYTDPFPTSDTRMGTYVFPWALRNSNPWLESIASRLSTLSDKPVEMVWAMKDPAFGKESVIARWLSYFPDANVDRISEASHYLQEDSPERVSAAIQRLLGRLAA